MRTLSALFLLFGFVACAGSTTTTSDASANDSASNGDGAAIACGSATCGAKEWCIHPCCGGPAPQCVAPTDAGTCPPNTTTGQCFGGGGGPTQGCVPPPCVPPPPFCAPKPNSCPNGMGQGPVDNGQVSCLCA